MLINDESFVGEAKADNLREGCRYCLGCPPHRANRYELWLPNVEVEVDHCNTYLFPLQAQALELFFHG